MKADNLLTLDIGTLSTRATLFQGPETLHLSQQANQLSHLDEKQVEQDANALLKNSKSVIEDCVNHCQGGIQALGIAIQRSTVVAWDRHSGHAILPALSWQDRRCEAQISALQSHGQEVKARSGLVLSPHYGASKLAFLHALAQHRGHAKQDYLAGPLISFILYNLLEKREFICDESNAARTQLWNIQERCWDEHLCHLFQVDISTLPQVLPTHHNYGNLTLAAAPLHFVAGDQNAALLALEAFSKQKDCTAICNCGTGAFIISNKNIVEKNEDEGALLTGIKCSTDLNVDFILEGTVNGAGSALNIIKDKWLKLNPSETKESFYTSIANWQQSDATPSIFINTVGGLGSPFWASPVKAHFIDVDGNASIEKDVIAVLESIVFLIAQNFQLMQRKNHKLNALICSGGLSRSSAFCQLLADCCGVTVTRAETKEGTSEGIAFALRKIFRADSEKTEAHRGVSTGNTADSFTPQKRKGLEQRYTLFLHHLQNYINSPAAALPENTRGLL